MKQKTIHDFPTLANLAQKNAQMQPMRICIVTPDLIGPVKNGGIGTACAYLAFAMAEAGNSVDILFTQQEAKKKGEWINSYSSKGITINFPPELDNCKTFFPDSQHVIMAMRIYEWLKIQPAFDAILFMDMQGNGFYALQAKHCGLHFSNTSMIIICHSPTFWQLINNASLPANPIEGCLWQMERTSIALADAVISPSQYLLKWFIKSGWRLPAPAYVQPNIMQRIRTVFPQKKRPIDEIVFFGRLEYRKGLCEFCAALNILAKKGELPPKITFLGKCSFIGNEHSLLYLGRHSKNWHGSKIKLLLHYDQKQALRYLHEPGRLAVMPSVADNSPYSVYECLVMGIPFLARDVGGISELIAPKYRQEALFGDNPHELADKIANAVANQPFIAKLAFDLDFNVKAWIHGLPALIHQIGDKPKDNPPKKPFISVCLTHYNRPHFLKESLQSFLAQEYDNFELILADDGSDQAAVSAYLDDMEPIFLQRGWRILRLKHGFAGRARNVASQYARGEWLLFFDDDNIASPQMLKIFAQAACSSKAQLITTSFRVFKNRIEECEQLFLPLGDMISYAIIHNAISDTTAMVKKDIFKKFSGFSEDYGLGNEDFELWLKMVLSGVKIAIIPEPLFYYRLNPAETSVNISTLGAPNRMRSMRPFFEKLMPCYGELALLAHSMAITLKYCGDPDTDMDLIRMDPDDEDVQEFVTGILKKQGNPEFALDIQQSLENEKIEKLPEVFKITESIFNDCVKGHIENLQSRLSVMDGLISQLPQSERVEYISNIHNWLLNSLPENDCGQKLRGVILQKLALEKNLNTVASLTLAREFASIDFNQTALYFIKALMLAEQKYLQKRPDVKAAVKDGSFICGLHHYALHGRNENLIWPYARSFAKLLADSGLRQKLIACHAVAYKYNNITTASTIINSLV